MEKRVPNAPLLFHTCTTLVVYLLLCHRIPPSRTNSSNLGATHEFNATLAYPGWPKYPNSISRQLCNQRISEAITLL